MRMPSQFPAIALLSILSMGGLRAESAWAGHAWYEGGTLHTETALAWQQATAANKLATSADFVTKAYAQKMLKPEIQASFRTIDDFRPYAKELMLYLDAATKPDPDAAKNRKIFGKQRISELAVVGMLQLGWIR